MQLDAKPTGSCWAGRQKNRQLLFWGHWFLIHGSEGWALWPDRQVMRDCPHGSEKMTFLGGSMFLWVDSLRQWWIHLPATNRVKKNRNNCLKNPFWWPKDCLDSCPEKCSNKMSKNPVSTPICVEEEDPTHGLRWKNSFSQFSFPCSCDGADKLWPQDLLEK